MLSCGAGGAGSGCLAAPCTPILSRPARALDAETALTGLARPTLYVLIADTLRRAQATPRVLRTASLLAHARPGARTRTCNLAYVHIRCLLQVNDHLEEQMERGGFVVDHHSSDFFPERFFDLVVVLQTDNTLLYDRLQKRGYAERKIQENVQCEIMHVPCEEARRSYKQDIVQARPAYVCSVLACFKGRREACLARAVTRRQGAVHRAHRRAACRC